MKEFIYQAVDAKGETIKAHVKATTVEEAVKLLTERNLYPYSVEPISTSKFQIDVLLKKLHRIKGADTVIFTRQLATLIKAGLPIANAMRLLVGQMENPNMKELVQEVNRLLEAGNTLAESLAKYPDVFNKVYLNIVEAGETSGKLEDVLLKLADQEERNAEINRKIKGALMYPAVILVVILIVAAIMISVVLPEVGKIYVELKQEVPFQTKILLNLADFMKKFWWLFAILFAGAVYGIRIYISTTDGRKAIDRLKLNIPMFKTLVRKLYMTRFTSTLSALVNSGVPVLQALDITSRAINNVHLEKSIKAVAVRVKGGAALSKPIEDDPLFLPLVGKMIAVGEQTGTIGDSLQRIAGYYEDEVNDAVDNISSLIEPATMVVLGLIIAFLVAAVLLPIYGIVNNIR